MLSSDPAHRVPPNALTQRRSPYRIVVRTQIESEHSVADAVAGGQDQDGSRHLSLSERLQDLDPRCSHEGHDYARTHRPHAAAPAISHSSDTFHRVKTANVTTAIETVQTSISARVPST